MCFAWDSLLKTGGIMIRLDERFYLLTQWHCLSFVDALSFVNMSFVDMLFITTSFIDMSFVDSLSIDALSFINVSFADVLSIDMSFITTSSIDALSFVDASSFCALCDDIFAFFFRWSLPLSHPETQWWPANFFFSFLAGSKVENRMPQGCGCGWCGLTCHSHQLPQQPPALLCLQSQHITMDTEWTLPPQYRPHHGGEVPQLLPIVDNNNSNLPPFHCQPCCLSEVLDNDHLPPQYCRPRRLHRVDEWNFIVALILGLASGIFILYTLVWLVSCQSECHSIFPVPLPLILSAEAPLTGSH